MSETFQVVEYEDGVPVEETGHATREAGERRFAEAVERIKGEPSGAAHRVELWAEGIVLAIFDTEDQP